MKKITTILLMLSACVLSLSARELHADLTTTAVFAGLNGSWDSGTKTFTWTAGNNSRVVFSDLIGQNGDGISAWDTLVVNVTSCTDSYRIDFQLSTGKTISNGASGSKTAFWTAGTKKIVLSEVLTAAQTDTVTEIRLNTNSNNGNLVLGDIYLIDDAKPYSTASAGLVKRTANGNCDFGGKLEWTAGNANTMQVFSMTAGDLSEYTSMKVNFRNFYDRGSIGAGIKTRVVFRTSSADVKGQDYYTLTTSGSIGTSEKTIDLTTQLTPDQRATITQVVLGGGGSANAGFVMIDPSDIKLVKSDESELVCTSITARGGDNSSNVSYKENIFYWTANSANTMQLFSLKAGDLSGYETLEFTTSDFDKLDGSWTGSPYLYRVIFYKSGTEVTTKYFTSAGTKTINLSDLGSDQALVTEIVFGGANTGDCTKGLLTINPSSVLLKGYCYPITYNAGSGEGITGSQADDRKLDDVALTLPGIVFTRPNYVQVGWATSDGGEQVYALGGSYTANDQATLYPVWRPTIQTTQAAGNWSATGTWTNGIVPTEIDSVVLAHTVTVDNIAAVAKDVTIAPGGQLVIEACNKLKVVNQVNRWTGSAYAATETEDIVIGSSSAGNGALIMGSHNGTNHATVYFYSKSGGSKNSTASINQFIGTPFVSHTNWVYNYYNSWLLKVDYSAAKPVFALLGSGATMDPFAGYCVIYNGDAGHIYEMSGTLVATTDKTCSDLHYVSGTGSNTNNENLLANSWTAPIRIAAFETSDFVNTDATVYIFNSGSKDDVDNNDPTAGQYVSYPINAAGDNVIPSMQSFSVYTNASGGSSVTLDYSKLVYDPAVAGTAVVGPNKAPQREETTRRMRILVQGENGFGDILSLLEREDLTTGFDNGWDGRKMYGESFAPQFYAVTPDGNMAVNSVPDWEGTVLGFKAGSEDNTYTFSFEYNEPEPLYLLDTENDTYTRVLNENTYTFATTDKNDHSRFILTRHAPQTPTEVTNVQSDKAPCTKILLDNNLYILRDGRLYNVTGAMVK